MTVRVREFPGGRPLGLPDLVWYLDDGFNRSNRRGRGSKEGEEDRDRGQNTLVSPVPSFQLTFLEPTISICRPKFKKYRNLLTGLRGGIKNVNILSTSLKEDPANTSENHYIRALDTRSGRRPFLF